MEFCKRISHPPHFIQRVELWYDTSMLTDIKPLISSLEDHIRTSLSHTNKKVCFVVFHKTAPTMQFVAMKSRFGERVDVTCVVRESIATTVEEAVEVLKGCKEEGFDGIVVQLPLPESLRPHEEEILNTVPIQLDCDVLSKDALHGFVTKQHGMMPPVARAVYEILTAYQVDLTNKKILLVGNGRLVGAPVALFLTKLGVTYDVIDINSSEEETKKRMSAADIIITGAGSPGLIKKEMIKEGVVLIDAGTSEQKGKVVGDVDPSCYEKASLVTPVPGGVGPLTVASLFMNLVDPMS